MTNTCEIATLARILRAESNYTITYRAAIERAREILALVPMPVPDSE